MATKKPAKTKARAKFKDLKTKKSVKGGAFDTYMKVTGVAADSSSPVLFNKTIT